MSNKVTYTPGSGESEVTNAFGLFFEAGKPVAVENEEHFKKLKGNPMFTVGGKEEPEDKARADSEKRLSKAMETRQTSAQKAREAAAASQADAEAADRALEQAAAIRAAEAEAAAEGQVG